MMGCSGPSCSLEPDNERYSGLETALKQLCGTVEGGGSGVHVGGTLCGRHIGQDQLVYPVMEPLLASLGGSGQAWCTLEGWVGWDGCFLQKVPVTCPELWWKGCGTESCSSRWQKELSCLAWSLRNRRPQAGKCGCCRGGWCSCPFWL